MSAEEFDSKQGWCIRQVGKRNPEIALVYGASRHNCEEGQPEARATTRRIVACVNALAGIDDPAAFVSGRDDLLATLKSIAHVCGGAQSQPRPAALADTARAMALAAIVKAEAVTS